MAELNAHNKGLERTTESSTALRSKFSGAAAQACR